ncbi:carboxymuconolactone decarboxylase family protein [Negadavirga shengliensis]|uniref:Carboxymuconolactone decarboxylase family protein n=1 Tax=Negadavirga shengliensis TaxID=1389218 RepID=A0ABV9T4E3_9BACT
MKQRISIKDLEPAAYKAMFGLEKYLASTSLEAKLKHLVKIRASQINGCAYCIEMHSEEALQNGEETKRIFALAAWKESPLFSEEEKAVLAMTDEVSLIAQQGLSEPTYQMAKRFFNDNQIAQLIMQIGTINLWNRIAVSTHMFHKEPV